MTTRDLLETTVLNHPDSTTTRVVSQEMASEVASEVATVTVETSEETTITTTAEETSAVHLEVDSEVETHLEGLAVSADRAVETTALAELALTNNE